MAEVKSSSCLNRELFLGTTSARIPTNYCINYFTLQECKCQSQSPNVWTFFAWNKFVTEAELPSSAEIQEPVEKFQQDAKYVTIMLCTQRETTWGNSYSATWDETTTVCSRGCNLLACLLFAFFLLLLVVVTFLAFQMWCTQHKCGKVGGFETFKLCLWCDSSNCLVKSLQNCSVLQNLWFSGISRTWQIFMEQTGPYSFHVGSDVLGVHFRQNLGWGLGFGGVVWAKKHGGIF